MTPEKIILLLNFITAIEELIDTEVDRLRGKGEMTPEAEAAYQARQKAVYSMSEAKPSPSPETGGP